ncbi:hypothetical protein [Novosphingobium malaysiense]|nr:hypothetical protein [Novosphingobium malaysiense]
MATLVALGSAGTARAQEAADATSMDQRVDAQVVAELEAEADQSSSEAGALALSQSKSEKGDLTGAAAVLERYLLIDKNAIEPRSQYAVLLCRLDDLQSGKFEGAKVASEAPGSEALDRVKAMCGGVTDLSEYTGGGMEQ